MLSKSESVRYLGVQIDSCLNWKNQIDFLTSRVVRLIYIFKSLRHSAQFEILKMTYLALCQSVINYSICVWGGADKSAFLKLERAQRAVLKVMLKKSYRYPTTQLYDDCKVLTVRQLFVLRSILRKHKSVPPPGKDKRRHILISMPHRTSFAQHQYYVLSPYLYAQIDKLLKIVHLNSYEIKEKLTDWLLTQDYCKTEDLLTFIS